MNTESDKAKNVLFLHFPQGNWIRGLRSDPFTATRPPLQNSRNPIFYLLFASIPCPYIPSPPQRTMAEDVIAVLQKSHSAVAELEMRLPVFSKPAPFVNLDFGPTSEIGRLVRDAFPDEAHSESLLVDKLDHLLEKNNMALYLLKGRQTSSGTRSGHPSDDHLEVFLARPPLAHEVNEGGFNKRVHLLVPPGTRISLPLLYEMMGRIWANSKRGEALFRRSLEKMHTLCCHWVGKDFVVNKVWSPDEREGSDYGTVAGPSNLESEGNNFSTVVAVAAEEAQDDDHATLLHRIVDMMNKQFFRSLADVVATYTRRFGKDSSFAESSQLASIIRHTIDTHGDPFGLRLVRFTWSRDVEYVARVARPNELKNRLFKDKIHSLFPPGTTVHIEDLYNAYEAFWPNEEGKSVAHFENGVRKVHSECCKETHFMWTLDYLNAPRTEAAPKIEAVVDDATVLQRVLRLVESRVFTSVADVVALYTRQYGPALACHIVQSVQRQGERFGLRLVTFSHSPNPTDFIARPVTQKELASKGFLTKLHALFAPGTVVNVQDLCAAYEMNFPSETRTFTSFEAELKSFEIGVRKVHFHCCKEDEQQHNWTMDFKFAPARREIDEVEPSRSSNPESEDVEMASRHYDDEVDTALILQRVVNLFDKSVFQSLDDVARGYVQNFGQRGRLSISAVASVIRQRIREDGDLHRLRLVSFDRSRGTEYIMCTPTLNIMNPKGFIQKVHALFPAGTAIHVEDLFDAYELVWPKESKSLGVFEQSLRRIHGGGKCCRETNFIWTLEYKHARVGPERPAAWALDLQRAGSDVSSAASSDVKYVAPYKQTPTAPRSRSRSPGAYRARSRTPPQAYRQQDWKPASPPPDEPNFGIERPKIHVKERIKRVVHERSASAPTREPSEEPVSEAVSMTNFMDFDIPTTTTVAHPLDSTNTTNEYPTIDYSVDLNVLESVQGLPEKMVLLDFDEVIMRCLTGS